MVSLRMFIAWHVEEDSCLDSFIREPLFELTVIQTRVLKSLLHMSDSESLILTGTCSPASAIKRSL